MNLIDSIKFNKEGLLPVIIQDISNNEILMLAYMNKISLRKTIETGETYFWSRSRNKLWHKGETSGHKQLVKEIWIDCDGDTLLIKIEQLGKAACHTGYRSCFHRKLDKDKWAVKGKKVFDAEEVYKK
jgi:phosphoribosyl-AMP cyclohydrolase